jgi:hypothetical protein
MTSQLNPAAGDLNTILKDVRSPSETNSHPETNHRRPRLLKPVTAGHQPDVAHQALIRLAGCIPIIASPIDAFTHSWPRRRGGQVYNTPASNILGKV